MRKNIFETLRTSNLFICKSSSFRSFSSGSFQFCNRAPKNPSAAKFWKAESLKKVVGIRKENKGKWERRAALAPHEVSELVQNNIQVLVQPSSLRVFSEAEYEKVGAIIREDLSDAAVILGVKEVPVGELLANKTFMFFSHTHKAQSHNMKMLDEILRKRIRLIDYEMMVDQKGTRVAKFGRFAGIAGMVDIFHGLSNHLLDLGITSPFLFSNMSKNVQNYQHIQEIYARIGSEIQSKGLNSALGPFSVVFTGNGAVSKGAREVFEMLPHQYVSIDAFREICASGNYNPRCLYGILVEEHHHMRKIGGTSFDKNSYRNSPHLYESHFGTEIAPFASVLVNGLYWEEKYPRILTNKQLRNIKASSKIPHRMLAIADISADVNGSIECTNRCTTLDDPFMRFDAVAGVYSGGNPHNSCSILSVDNLPAELSLDASLEFSRKLAPFVKALFEPFCADPNAILSHQQGALLRATVTLDGLLTEKFQSIQHLREQKGLHVKQGNPCGGVGSGSFGSKVLILGSGMVTAPIVDYLTKISAQNGQQKYQITIGSVQENEARKLIAGKQNCTFVHVDVANESARIRDLISSHHVVVSMVPASFHVSIAKECIRYGKHMVTASYASAEMKALHELACQAGIVILNEVGLDPGIDHMSAKKMMDEVESRGDHVEEFISWCGGLPAPEFSNNPLGYKFSWSPRGVLTAGKNAAHYRRGGAEVVVEGRDLFSRAEKVRIFPGFDLEGIPNRDSLLYEDLYGLKNPAPATMFRGTLRYSGFSNIMRGMGEIGLFDEGPFPCLLQYSQLSRVAGGNGGDFSPTWFDLTSFLLFRDDFPQFEKNLPAKISHRSAWIKNQMEIKLRQIYSHSSPLPPADASLLPRGASSTGSDAIKVADVLSAMQWLGMFEMKPILLPGEGAVKKGGEGVFGRNTCILDVFCQLLTQKLSYRNGERDVIILHHFLKIKKKDASVGNRTSTLVVYGDPTCNSGEKRGYSAMAKTVGLPVAICVDLISQGKLCQKGVMIPLTPDIYLPTLEMLKKEGIECVEQEWEESRGVEDGVVV